MKSILLLTILLFFVISPAYAQLSLSDATGLIDRLDVQTSGHVFEIKLVSNFDLTDYHFEKDQKQLVLYFESGLEDNLAEIVIPKNLLSGNFTFYLNDQEFFPKVQSNEKINFITLNFTGLGTNVIKISSTDYLSGLNEIVPIDNDISNTIDDDFLPPDRQSVQTFSNDYLMWFIVGVIVIIVVVFVATRFIKK